MNRRSFIQAALAAVAANRLGALDAAEPDASRPKRYPAKAAAIYHMMWADSGSPPLAQLPADANVVNLAFMQGDPPVMVGWGSQTQAQFIADARALRKRGVRVVASIGGGGGYVNIANRQRSSTE